MTKFSLIDKTLATGDPLIESRISKMKQPKLKNNDSSLIVKKFNGFSQREFGGSDGPEPTRYGDWENKGRCIDF